MEQEGTRGNRKESDDVVCGGVVQLVRTLLSNRPIDVNDCKISNLTQITSGRPVTVPSTFPVFPEAPVRSSSVPSRTFESRTSENDGGRFALNPLSLNSSQKRLVPAMKVGLADRVTGVS